jgi:hypothetical protein
MIGNFFLRNKIEENVAKHLVSGYSFKKITWILLLGIVLQNVE